MLMCGRRFGKTIFDSCEMCECAIDGWPVAYFAPTYKYTAETYRWCLSKLDPIVSRSDKTEGRIQLITGGVLDFWTLDKPDAGRSRKYKMAFIDEAGLVRDLENAWMGAIRPTLADYGGSAWFTGSPKGRGYFHKLWLRGQEEDNPKWKSWRFSTIDNPVIAADEIEDARAELPEHIFRQEFEGVPADDDGNPFGYENIRACIGEMSSKPAVVYGIDLARSVDYTVVIGLDEDGAVCDFFRENGVSWAALQDRMAIRIGSTPCLVDQTGVGSPLVEQIARVCPGVEGFTFTNQSKQQIIEGLQFALHRREITIPDEPAVISELEGFGYEYRAGRIYFNAQGTDHDDCVCALALAWHALDKMPRIEPGFLNIDLPAQRNFS